MNEANNFFTLQSLSTFGGTTLAVTVIGNAFRSLTGRDPKLLAFFSSVVICIVIAWSSTQQVTGYIIGLAFVNACLVYCTALGLTSQGSKIGPTHNKQPTRGKRIRSARNYVNKFFRPW